MINGCSLMEITLSISIVVASLLYLFFKSSVSCQSYGSLIRYMCIALIISVFVCLILWLGNGVVILLTRQFSRPIITVIRNENIGIGIMTGLK